MASTPTPTSSPSPDARDTGPGPDVGEAAVPEATVVVGIGEMGGSFSRGLLRTGHPVFPVTRTVTPAAVASVVPAPAIALVAVAEGDLHPVLGGLPASWRSRTGLLQNELLPRDWEAHDIDDPTVAVVWFEKKAGRAEKVILPTPVGGPAASLLVAALESISIPARVVAGRDELEFELVVKNVYILTVNLAGLETGGTVGALWHGHRPLFDAVASEVLDIQEGLLGRPVDRDHVITEVAKAIAADPEHGATGRSAPARLARALEHAKSLGIATPTLVALARHAGVPIP